MTEENKTEENTLWFKLGYVVAQIMNVLFWAFIFFMLWQLFVLGGGPQISFGWFVVFEACCHLAANKLNEISERNKGD